MIRMIKIGIIVIMMIKIKVHLMIMTKGYLAVVLGRKALMLVSLMTL